MSAFPTSNTWDALLLRSFHSLGSPGVKSAVLSPVCGTLILFGERRRKCWQCKAGREAVLGSVCYPKLQQHQPQM